MRKKGFIFFICIVSSFYAVAQFSENRLWYRQPATKWTEALPIGNGRLAAMVFGNPSKEQFQLNEESIWAGSKVNDINPGAKSHLKEIQGLLLDEKNKEAYDLTKSHMLGTPPQIRSYQPLGDLYITWLDTMSAVTDYTRVLDLSTAIHTTTYKRDRAGIEIQSFISAPADMLIIRILSSKPNLHFRISLARERDAKITTTSNRILMQGQIVDTGDVALKGPAGAHLRFASVAEIEQKRGKLVNRQGDLEVSGAREVIIRLTAASDYDPLKLDFNRNVDPMQICNSILGRTTGKPYMELQKEHLLEYQPLFNRCSIELTDQSQAALPTDIRLEKYPSDGTDNNLMALYFQYGRYLLLSSSRYPAKLPANLQGKWNPHFEAPWESDYHTNINLQMNYWPADLANVGETVQPLGKFMLAMLEPGKICAKEMYGAEGWVMHHVTDIYGRIAINGDPVWGTSPLAGAWMALSLFDHYDFSRDEQYLRDVAFPVMKESADFIRSFLIRDKNGFLVTAPSMSPENGFYLHGDTTIRHVVTYAPAIDVQIIRELFKAIRSVSAVMQISTDYLADLDKIEKNLPPTKINQYGGIQEWINDYQEEEPGHRHMSQLFGLYPGTSLTEDSLFLNASRNTIYHRRMFGGGHTGWSRAWMINFFARLKDGNRAFVNLEVLLKKSTLSNLFDNHPPFQIDGNFGGIAGIAEMLLQSHNNQIDLLPALPDAWPKGKVKGLKARGDITVDMEWDNGKLMKARFYSSTDQKIKIKYKTDVQIMDIKKGQILPFVSPN